MPGAWSVLGSSTSAGVGASTPAQAYVSQLTAAYAQYGVSVRNLAVAGSVTWQWLPTGSQPPAGRPVPYANNIDNALSSNPKLLMFSASTNDLVAGFSVDELISNLTSMRSYAMARGATVIILGPPPRTGGLSDAQRALLPTIDQRTATLAAPCFVSVLAQLGTSDYRIAPQYDAGDGVHNNDAGHGIIFRAFDDLLKSGKCVAKP
jgi:lysophospholipase L1-like esterase